MNPLIGKALLKPYNLTHGEIVSLLALEDTTELFAAAYELKCRHVGKVVSLRGLTIASKTHLSSTKSASWQDFIRQVGKNLFGKLVKVYSAGW